MLRPWGRGPKVHISSPTVGKSWGLVCSTVTVVNDTVLHNWKFLREQILIT